MTKKILFFDTETTGLVDNFTPIENQPHIVQFGAILGEYEEDGTIVSEQIIDLLVNPGIKIPQRLTDIHGISDTMVADHPGFDMIAKDLVKLFQDCDMIVGHNIEFDRKMIFVEMDRIWKKESPEKTEWKKMFKEKMFCTMEKSTDFCEIKHHGGGNKFPRLIELHQKLFGKGFDKAHNAVGDITATRNCFFEMKRLGLISF